MAYLFRGSIKCIFDVLFYSIALELYSYGACYFFLSSIKESIIYLLYSRSTRELLIALQKSYSSCVSSSVCQQEGVS